MTPRAKKKETRMEKAAKKAVIAWLHCEISAPLETHFVLFAQRERWRALREAADKAAAFKQCVGEMERNVGAEIERDILALGAKK